MTTIMMKMFLSVEVWKREANMAEQVTKVRLEHKFDESALHEYLERNFLAFPKSNGHLKVLQYRFVLLAWSISFFFN